MAADWLHLKSIRTIASKLLILSFLLLASACNQGARDLAPGRPINSFKVKTLEGVEFDLKQSFGSTTVLAFMASWCESCKSEIPWLSKVNKHLSQSGGKVIAVALDDNLTDLLNLKQDYLIDFEMAFDSQAKSRQYYKLTGFPEYLILDSKHAPKLIQSENGGMSLKLIGPQNWIRIFPEI
jgi:thiol-disulfide isomerase/thioredoxin